MLVEYLPSLRGSGFSPQHQTTRQTIDSLTPFYYFFCSEILLVLAITICAKFDLFVLCRNCQYLLTIPLACKLSNHSPIKKKKRKKERIKPSLASLLPVCPDRSVFSRATCIWIEAFCLCLHVCVWMPSHSSIRKLLKG